MTNWTRRFLAVSSSLVALLGLVVFSSWGETVNTLESESLPAILEELGELDRLDEPPIFESPIDPIFRPKEGIGARQRYQHYLGKIDPLIQHLNLVNKRLKEAPEGEMTLQELAALNHSSLRIYESMVPRLTIEERRFTTFSTVSRAVVKLDETVQYWRIRHTLTPPFRTEEMAVSEDRYVLDLKLQALQQALAELDDWFTLHQTLQTGFKPAEE